MSTSGASAGIGSAKDIPAKRSDWPTEIADRLEKVTLAVEQRTVQPLVGLARLAVYGILALILLMVVGTLASVALVRLLNVYLFTGADWASFAVTGGILALVGLLLWGMRTKKRAS